MFKTINEELKIYSFSGEDSLHLSLSQEARERLTKKDENGVVEFAKMIYSPEDDTIYLNRDMKYYDTYESIVESYLSLRKETAESIKELAPDSLKKTMDFLYNIVKDRNQVDSIAV